MMSKARVNEKSLITRFEKDAKGALTTLLILGIFVKEKRLWSYQIKKKLKEITNSSESISNSSLYTLLGRLEEKYDLISSEKDEEDQRRYFLPKEHCFTEFKELIEFWNQLMETSRFALKNIELLDDKEWEK